MKTLFRIINKYSIWLILFIIFSAFICDVNPSVQFSNCEECNRETMKYYVDFIILTEEWNNAYCSGNLESLKPFCISFARYFSAQFAGLLAAGRNSWLLRDRGGDGLFRICQIDDNCRE
jgi:hypothetical protein